MSTPPPASFSTLPVELHAEILHLAAFDGHEMDMETVKALTLVNKAAYQITAPFLFETINLSRMSSDKMKGFFDLRPATRDMVRYIRTQRIPGWFGAQTAEPFVEAATIAEATSNLEGLEVVLLDSYEAAAPGWVMFNHLAQTVYPKLSRFRLHLSASQIDPSLVISIGVARPLDHLDPACMQRLSLNLSGLSQTDVERFISAISRFPILTHLENSLTKASFPASSFTSFPCPLKYLNLYVVFGSFSLDDVASLLPAIAPTLECLILDAAFARNPATDAAIPPFNLPNLRQLRCGMGNPVDLLHHFLSSPLEVLEITTPGSLYGGGRSSSSLVQAIQALEKLEVLIYNEDIVDTFAFEEIIPLFQLLAQRGVTCLDETADEEGGEKPRGWKVAVEDWEDWSIL